MSVLLSGTFICSCICESKISGNRQWDKVLQSYSLLLKWRTWSFSIDATLAHWTRCHCLFFVRLTAFTFSFFQSWRIISYYCNIVDASKPEYSNACCFGDALVFAFFVLFLFCREMVDGEGGKKRPFTVEEKHWILAVITNLFGENNNKSFHSHLSNSAALQSFL